MQDKNFKERIMGYAKSTNSIEKPPESSENTDKKQRNPDLPDSYITERFVGDENTGASKYNYIKINRIQYLEDDNEQEVSRDSEVNNRHSFEESYNDINKSSKQTGQSYYSNNNHLDSNGHFGNRQSYNEDEQDLEEDNSKTIEEAEIDESYTENESEGQEDAFDIYRNKELSTIYEENLNQPTSRVDDGDFESTNLRRTIMTEEINKRSLYGSELKSGGDRDRWSNVKKKIEDNLNIYLGGNTLKDKETHHKVKSFSERTFSDNAIKPLNYDEMGSKNEDILSKISNKNNIYRGHSSSMDYDAQKKNDTIDSNQSNNFYSLNKFTGSLITKSNTNFNKTENTSISITNASDDLKYDDMKQKYNFSKTEKISINNNVAPATESNNEKISNKFEQAKQAIFDLEKKREMLEKENEQLKARNDETSKKQSVTYNTSSKNIDSHEDSMGQIINLNTVTKKLNEMYDEEYPTAKKETVYNNYQSNLNKYEQSNLFSKTDSNFNKISSRESSHMTSAIDLGRERAVSNEKNNNLSLNYGKGINTIGNHNDTSSILNPINKNSEIFDNATKSKCSDKDIEEIRDQILTRRNQSALDVQQNDTISLTTNIQSINNQTALTSPQANFENKRSLLQKSTFNDYLSSQNSLLHKYSSPEDLSDKDLKISNIDEKPKLSYEYEKRIKELENQLANTLEEKSIVEAKCENIFEKLTETQELNTSLADVVEDFDNRETQWNKAKMDLEIKIRYLEKESMIPEREFKDGKTESNNSIVHTKEHKLLIQENQYLRDQMSYLNNPEKNCTARGNKSVKDYLSPISKTKSGLMTGSILNTEMSLGNEFATQQKDNVNQQNYIVYQKFCESILGMLNEIGLLDNSSLRDNLKKAWKALKKIITDYFILKRYIDAIKKKTGVTKNEDILGVLEKLYTNSAGEQVNFLL